MINILKPKFEKNQICVITSANIISFKKGQLVKILIVENNKTHYSYFVSSLDKKIIRWLSQNKLNVKNNSIKKL